VLFNPEFMRVKGFKACKAGKLKKPGNGKKLSAKQI